MIRKIAKFTGWLLGGILALGLFFYLIVIAINWHDVPPSAEAIHFTQTRAKRPHVADEQNAFVYLVGMSVKPGFDPMQAGVARIERVRHDHSEGTSTGFDHPDFPEFDYKKERTQKLEEMRVACRSSDQGCVEWLTNNPKITIGAASSDGVLVERYRALLAVADWQDIYPQGLASPIPSYAKVMDGQVLSLFDILQQSEVRTPTATIALLDNDARFWRNVLVSSDSLISSMVAVALLKRNLFWTNLVLRRLAARDMVFEFPAQWQRPITEEERSLLRAFVGEWTMIEPTMRSLFEQIEEEQALSNGGVSTGERFVTWLVQPLHQPQDSINRLAYDFTSTINEFNVPYEQLPALAVQQETPSEASGDEELALPHVLYNPVGKYFYVIARPNSGRYLFRVADLEGGRRALLATHQLRSGNYSREKLGEVLASSRYRNPYTNQPFHWDEATQSVEFEGLDKGTSERKRYLFLY